MIIYGIELHDLPVTGIGLDFVAGIIAIRCDVYDEEKIGYKTACIKFTEVTNVVTDTIDVLKSQDIEIYSAEVTNCESGGYSIAIVFLTGYAKPSFEMRFNYTDVTVDIL